MALIFSFVSILLAIGPTWGGQYDPTLAVLTATLVAIVWYTYFTYKAVIKEEEPRLIAGLGGDQENRTLNFVFRNLSQRRTLRGIFFGEIWRDAKSLEIPPALQGLASEQVILQPSERWEQQVPIATPKTIERGPQGPAASLSEPEQFVVILGAVWQDDLGDRGFSGPHFHAVEVVNVRIQRLIVQGQIQRHAKALPYKLTAKYLKKATRWLGKNGA